MRTTSLAIAVAALMLVTVPTAFADPGAPGLDRASTSVYGNSSPPPELGRTPPAPVLGEEESGNTPPAEEQPTTGRGSVPTITNGSGGANVGGGGGGNDKSLPFTGYAAALVLGSGLTALLLGLTGHAAARRLRRV